MNKQLLLFSLLLIGGCTQTESDIGLEVPIKTSGCAGFEESFSDVTITNEGLSVVSNVISPHPCYSLTKAEVSRVNNQVTVFFTMEEETGPCDNCLGVQSMVYKILGKGLNQTGINVEVITYFGSQQVRHSFTT